MAKKNNEVTFNIIKSFGVLSSKEYDRTNWQTKEKEHVVDTKELCLVSWNGGTPKFEVRIWSNVDGVLSAGKGVTFTEEELDNFRFILESIDESKLETEATA